MNRSNGEAVIKKWDYGKLFSCKKKEEIMPFGKMWMDPGAIMLSEIGLDREKQILYELTYMWNL